MEDNENAPEAANMEAAEQEKDQAEETTPLNDTVDSKHRFIDDSEVCCCCICHCSEERTRSLSCFGCFPIKCGIVSTGILTVALIVSSFTEIFYFILNDFIHWWYVLVCVLLLVPAIIGACFIVKFFNRDDHGTRGLVRTAYIQVIISYTLIAIWQIIYFNCWYKSGEVIAGSEQTGYYRLTKKQYLFWSLFTTCVIDSFYAYFICIIAHYRNALKDDEEKEKKDEEKA